MIRFKPIERVRRSFTGIRSGLVKNTIVLMSSSVFGQILMFAVSPVLLRLYSPEDFGNFAFFTSTVGILSVFACLRLDQAIVVPEKDEDAGVLVKGCLIITATVSALTFLIVPYAFRGNAAFNEMGFPAAILLSASVLLSGIYQCMDYWNSRMGLFSRMAARQVAQTSSTAGVQLAFGYMAPMSGLGLIIGTMAGQLVATVRLIALFIKDGSIHLITGVTLRRVLAAIRLHRRFPMFAIWTDLISSVSTAIPVYAIGFYFDLDTVGQYSNAMRLLVVPMSIVGISLSHVFYPKANEAKAKGLLGELVVKTVSGLFSISIVPVIGLAIVAPPLFAMAFGEEWRQAGLFAAMLCPMVLFQFVSSPISMVFPVLNRQEYLLGVTVSLLGVRFLSIYAGHQLGEELLAIFILGFSTGAVYLMSLLIILKISKADMSSVIRIISRIMLCSVLPIILMLMVRLLVKHDFSLVAICGVICLADFLLKWKATYNDFMTGVDDAESKTAKV